MAPIIKVGIGKKLFLFFVYVVEPPLFFTSLITPFLVCDLHNSDYKSKLYYFRHNQYGINSPWNYKP